MSFIRLFLVILASSVLIQIFLPASTWLSMLVAFVSAMLLGRHWLAAFFAGFLGLGLVWLSQAFIMDYLMGATFSHVFTNFILSVFGVTPYKLMLLTGLIGGLMGGTSAWSGYLLRRALRLGDKRED